jgi:taurine dioxygenase
METVAALKTRPLTPTFGVEILDIDLNKADAATLNAVEAAVYRHGAVVIPGQTLSPEQQLRFTSIFGEPEENEADHTDLYSADEGRKVFVISNKIVDGKPIGFVEAGVNWHTDLSYSRRPALCTILYALEVPKVGSDTLVADLVAAWETLPAQRKRELHDLRVTHSLKYLNEKRGHLITTGLSDEIPEAVEHPLVRKLPEDGRETLWISIGSTREIVGMPNPDGLNMLKELMDYSTQPKFVYQHKWKVGDVLVWDNRRTLHKGTPFDVDNDIRLVHRTWVKGEAPIQA